jgi:nucleotide-binding universal stress UspA family protein
MLTLQKILVPIDFSERSVAAARHAVALAHRFDSQLTFLHVIPSPPLEFAGFEGGYYTARLQPPGQDALAHFTARMQRLAEKASPDRPAEINVRDGDPAKEIEAAAKDLPADLIVMPTHGYGPFRRFILGSVTAKVLHDLACPVLTGAHVPEIPPDDPRPYHKVACAVDLSPHSEKVLRWAADFAAAYQAGLALIHAAPGLDVGGDAGQQAPGELRALLLRSAHEQAEELLAKTGCRAEIHVDSAPVPTYVSSALRAFGADLLVIGRSVREGLAGRLRANAYSLLRESPCAVVSV